MIGHPNLKARWTLNSASIDSSGNGVNGIDVNVTYGNYGKFGNGVLFQNSNGYISMGNQLDYEYTQPVTISCWIKNNTTGDSNIITKQANSDAYQGYGIGTRSPSGFIQVLWYTGSTSFIFTINSAVADTLHHFAVSYDGSNTFGGFTAYLDGVTQTKTRWGAIDPALTSTIRSTYPFQLSGRGGSSSCWNGQLDDVQIYNKALSQSDIKRIMNGFHPLLRS